MMEQSSSPRELIVIRKPEADVAADEATPAAAPSDQPGGFAKALESDEAKTLLESQEPKINTLSGLTEERMRVRAAASAPSTAKQPTDLSRYYAIVDAPDNNLERLAAVIEREDDVEAAYVKPRGESPIAPPPGGAFNTMEPLTVPPGVDTPDFSGGQTYLDAAPGGIDARYAWTLEGGRGAGVRIIDLEWGWRFNHEDLTDKQGGVVAGVNSSDDNHGTAVLGVYSGDRNGFGITGIAPDAQTSAIAFSMPSATAIRLAADRLRPGDIMLLEIHRAGPLLDFEARRDQKGYIPVEWWPDDFAAIQYAVGRGVIVVEAAGNGGENLDASIYNTPDTGFPASWVNPLDPANASSGAIIVGAGAPPLGTHGTNQHGPDRSRLSFSNFGARVDVQGWGQEVTTTGYGDLQGGPNRDEWYTNGFNGTSSASPMIVGALACVQGVLRAQGRPLLTPASAMELLRTTGSPQQDAPSRLATQRIGNLPNLRELIRLTGQVWYSDVGVSMTYATTHSQNAWASIGDLGWRKIKPGSPESVTSMFRHLCEASAAQRNVKVMVDNAFIFRVQDPD